MLNLIETELKKMKRRKFLVLATLAAVILPIPLSVLTAKTGQGYDFLYKSVINLGQFMLLIPVLCIVAAMLFFEERDNNTLKLLLTIPVQASKLVWAKLLVLLVVSVGYSFLAFAATIVGTIIGRVSIDHIMQKMMLCMVTGVMTWVAALPCIALIVLLSKNYIMSVLFSFLYAVIGFIVSNATVVMPAPNPLMVLPVNVINRWLLPIFQNLNTAEYPFDIAPSSVGTMACGLYLIVYTVLFGWLICKGFDKWNN